MKHLLFFVFGLLLSGIAPAQERIGITFLNNPGPEFDAVLPDVEEKEVLMQLRTHHGVWGIDNKNALLYGWLGDNTQYFQSVLLRTRDGGITWKEAMTPVPRASVDFLTFVDDQNGFLVVDSARAVGRTTMLIFITTDGGDSWTQTGRIEKPGYCCHMARASFADGLYELTLHCECRQPEDGRYTYISSDMGRTWTQKGPRVQIANSWHEKRIDRQLMRKGLGKNSSKATDQTVWQVDPGMEWLYVWHLPPGAKQYEFVRKFPARYVWKRGRVFNVNR